MKPFNIQQSAAVLIFVSLLTGFFVAVFFVSAHSPHSVSLIEKQEVVAVKLPPPQSPFFGVEIQAKSAYVLDARTGEVLFSKNEEARLPLASLTKVMTAVVVSEIPAETVVSFPNKERWKLKDLLDYTLVVSSNDGASALASAGGAFLSDRVETKKEKEDSFVQEMNRKAKELGLLQTSYLNPHGLDVSDTLSGGYGSAKDTAHLFEYVLKNKPTLMEATGYGSLQIVSLDGIVHPAQNTDTLAREIPGLLASKTGYTDLAGGNLAIAFDVGPAHPVIVVAMGSTQEGRFTDVQKLVAASVQSVAQK
jgi:D-alanyl-D-alanine carboxypeptidase (penicillin-binding protein 5/6)